MKRRLFISHLGGHRMRRPSSVFICFALMLSSGACLSPALGRQSGTSGGTTEPQDVRLSVDTGNGKTQFQIGETIPLKLSFTSAAVKKYQINLATYDRSGRMH